MVILGLLPAACAVSPYDRSYVSEELQKSAGAGFAAQPAARFATPEGVRLEDGLGENEAVAVALWNNAGLQADLADLGLARADLAAAGAFPNPIVSLLFHESSQYEATFSLPIDLISRHSRVTAAKEQVERVAADLVAKGLDLAREVRIVHAELLLARDKQTFLDEYAALARDLAEIAAAQFETGKISEQAYADRRTTAADADLSALTARQEAAAKSYRLLELLGMGDDAPGAEIQLSAANATTVKLPELGVLIDRALEFRPEMRSAEAALSRAGAQAKWERTKLLDFTAQLKVDRGASETASSPGVQFELPLFYQNQGGRGRANAEVLRAAQTLLATQRAIRREVREARSGYAAATQAVALWEREIVPSLQAEAELAQRAYGLGQNSYADVALAQGRYLQAKIKAAAALNELRRATARLAHSLGRQITEESPP